MKNEPGRSTSSDRPELEEATREFILIILVIADCAELAADQTEQDDLAVGAGIG